VSTHLQLINIIIRKNVSPSRLLAPHTFCLCHGRYTATFGLIFLFSEVGSFYLQMRIFFLQPSSVHGAYVKVVQRWNKSF
jgi:hypothetical protein